MDRSRSGTRPLRWLIGALLGILTGLLLGIAPLFGLIIGALAASWALAGRPRLAASSGLLVGAGGAYLALLARALADCRTMLTPGFYQDCRPPDNLIVYESGAVAMLVFGVALLVMDLLLAARAQRASHNGED